MVTTNWHPTLSFNSIFFWIIREENPCSCWEGNGPWFPVGPFYSLPQIISLHEDSKLKITDQLLFHRKTQKNTIIAALKSTTFMFLFFYIFGCIFEDYLFLERGEGREKERERNINVWEIHWLVASCMPPLGTWPTTQACALTRNWTSDPSVCRPAPNPLSHTSQDYFHGLHI